MTLCGIFLIGYTSILLHLIKIACGKCLSGSLIWDSGIARWQVLVLCSLAELLKRIFHKRKMILSLK